ncbi:MAG: sensor histidine kinase [Spirochaetota bacterium]
MITETTNPTVSGTERILIVDDDDLVIESFERVFTDPELPVILEKTTDSREALRLIESNDYDLVITDLVMPDVDGIQVLRRAKEIRPESEVILITAYSSYNTAVDAMFFGAFDYISKPINTSELKFRITRALEKRRAVVEKNNKIREMERLFYTLSHDFKATILSIKSFVDILAREHLERLEDEDARFLTERVIANVQTMESIMERLLEYSRIGKLEEDWENIDTGRVVREICANFQPALQEQGITLTAEEPLPPVYFYRRGLQSVFANLIDNAIKYSRGGSGAYIRIGAMPAENGFHRFFVEDNGIGIERQNLQVIFEIFQRESKGLQEQGYGIGLAIVKKILENARCSITAESVKNEKTVFTFTLPRARPVPETGTTPEQQPGGDVR